MELGRIGTSVFFYWNHLKWTAKVVLSSYLHSQIDDTTYIFETISHFMTYFFNWTWFKQHARHYVCTYLKKWNKATCFDFRRNDCILKPSILIFDTDFKSKCTRFQKVKVSLAKVMRSSDASWHVWMEIINLCVGFPIKYGLKPKHLTIFCLKISNIVKNHLKFVVEFGEPHIAH